MNRRNLRELIKVLETEVDDEHFDMNRYLCNIALRQQISSLEYLDIGDALIPPCRTAGCIAGTYFLRVLNANERGIESREYKRLAPNDLLFRWCAKRGLDLTEYEAKALFEPAFSCGSMVDVTRSGAIAVLKHLDKTGWIDFELCPGIHAHRTQVDEGAAALGE